MTEPGRDTTQEQGKSAEQTPEQVSGQTQASQQASTQASTQEAGQTQGGQTGAAAETVTAAGQSTIPQDHQDSAATDATAGADAPATPEQDEAWLPGQVVPEEARPDKCRRIFHALSHVGPLVLLLALAAQVWPDFWHAWRGDALYCPAEGGSIAAFFRAVADGSWLTPGSAGGAQWPVFIWFMGALAPLPVQAFDKPDLLFPLAGSLGAALALLATWGLARAAGFGPQAALASGLILLCAPLFAPLGHFTGPAALAASLLLLSLLCFCRGWQARRAWLSLPAAFVLAGFAGLAGGPCHLFLPLAASLCFLIWRGDLRRAQSLDALAGFVLLLLVLGGWFAAVLLGTDNGQLRPLLDGALQSPWPLAPLWWFPAALAAVGLVPWLLLVFGVSWFRVLGQCGTTLGASRRSGGVALLWISLVLGLLFSLCIPAARCQGVAVALVCVAAPLLGKAFLRLPPLGSRLFFLLVALLLLVAGLILLGLGFEFSQAWVLRLSPVSVDAHWRGMLLGLNGLPVAGLVCLLAAVVMTRFVRRDHGGGELVAATLMSILLAQPASLMIAPELGAMPDARLAPLSAIRETALASPAAVPVPGVAPLPGAPLPHDGTAPGLTPPPVPQGAEPALPPAAAQGPAAPEPAAQEPAAPPASAQSGGAPLAAPEAAPVPGTTGNALPEGGPAPVPDAAPQAVPQTGPQPVPQTAPDAAPVPGVAPDGAQPPAGAPVQAPDAEGVSRL